MSRMAGFGSRKGDWRLLMITCASGLLMTTACHKDTQDLRTREQKAADFDNLLARGRGNNHNAATSQSRGFFLAGSGSDTEVSAIHDDTTDALTWITFDTTRMPSVGRESLSENCVGVVDSRSGDFQVNSEELLAINPGHPTVLANDLQIVSFTRTINGVQVRDTYLDCVYAPTDQDDFRLREIVNRTGGDIRVSNQDDIVPDEAKLAEKTGIDDFDLLGSREVIKRVDGPSGPEYYLAREFSTVRPDSTEIFTITITHGDFAVVEAFGSHVEVKRRVFKANVYNFGYRDNTFADLPLAFATVIGSRAAVTLDADGAGELEDTDTSVTVSLTGPRAALFDVPTSTTAVVSLTVPVNGDTVVIPNTVPQFQAVNTFINVQRINTFVRRQLAGSAASILTQAIAVGINVVGACNAFFDPGNRQISLFASGTAGATTCPAMGTINDVLYHEWGHGLDNALGRTAGITDGAFSEGIGDILATYYTNIPLIGRGFFQGTDNGIRTVDNAIKYPDGRGEVHDEGRIIGGAFWDMRKGLIQRYGQEAGASHAEKLFINHLANTDAYLESYENVLRLDDNDGNAATPSPNRCIINAAFATHGLATKEDPCNDIPEGTGIKFDDNIRLAVGAAGTANAGKLMASVLNGPVRMQICKGDWRTCVPADKTDIELVPEGTTGDRMIFVSKDPYTLTEQEQLTLISKDKYGMIVGVKTLKFASR